MSRQLLQDNSGRLLGWIVTESNGNQAIYSVNGRLLGRYSVFSNLTTDVDGKLVGRGNLLSSLLIDWRG